MNEPLVEADHPSVGHEDGEEEEALQTVEDDKEENDDSQGCALLVVEEEADNAKDPGEAEHAEDPDVDDQVGAAAMTMLLRLDDGGDVVDADDSEDVEDGVGENDKEHRQAKEDKSGGADADPTAGDAVADGEAGDNAAVLDGEADGDDAGRYAVSVHHVLGQVSPFGADLKEVEQSCYVQ